MSHVDGPKRTWTAHKPQNKEPNKQMAPPKEPHRLQNGASSRTLSHLLNKNNNKEMVERSVKSEVNKERRVSYGRSNSNAMTIGNQFHVLEVLQPDKFEYDSFAVVEVVSPQRQ